MAKEECLTAEYARQILDYCQESGEFRWKQRCPSLFRTQRDCSAWNSRFATAVAGSHDGNGYRIIIINYQRHMAHRLAWLYVHGVWPCAHVDHINGNPMDNRIANLREASSVQNMANSRKRKNNKSGFKGVFWSKNAGKWTAQIRDGRSLHLGYFDKAEDAAAAYDDAARQLHREFARTNANMGLI